MDEQPSIELLGMPLAPLSLEQLLDHLGAALQAGRGGWVVTANLDILVHFLKDPAARAAYLAADLRVADGMPLVWASRVKGSPLPERVAGATLTVSLAARAERHDWSVGLFGGSPGTAERAATKWRGMFPRLRVMGDSTLMISSPPSQDQIELVIARAREHACDVVLVGLGSPKQELLIQHLRTHLPATWFVGVGGTFSFLTGDISRAPIALQRLGLEWLHRLLLDPRRLGRRYLLDDMPVFFRLMLEAATSRRE